MHSRVSGDVEYIYTSDTNKQTRVASPPPLGTTSQSHAFVIRRPSDRAELDRTCWEPRDRILSNPSLLLRNQEHPWIWRGELSKPYYTHRTHYHGSIASRWIPPGRTSLAMSFSPEGHSREATPLSSASSQGTDMDPTTSSTQSSGDSSSSQGTSLDAQKFRKRAELEQVGDVELQLWSAPTRFALTFRLRQCIHCSRGSSWLR